MSHWHVSQTSTNCDFQGCCLSRSAGPNSPYPGGAPSSSSRAINAAPGAINLPDPAQPPRNAQAQDPPPARRRRQQIPLDQKINRPLKRHKWAAKDGSTWTKRQLADEREAFFDTRVTGRQEVWQTLHAALQALWDGDPAAEEEDGSDGFALAQSILTAGDILLPTGNLANGVYDSFGNYYPLPEHIVCDPTNVADDLDIKAEVSTAADDTAADDDDVGAEANAEEKGKGVVDVREQVTLCARLSENARDYHVTITAKESIRSVAKKISERAKVGTHHLWIL